MGCGCNNTARPHAINALIAPLSLWTQLFQTGEDVIALLINNVARAEAVTPDKYRALATMSVVSCCPP